MARRKSISRKRIAIGAVVLIFLVAVVLSGGQDLNLADPFAGGLDFRDIELSYSLFSIANIEELNDFVGGTNAEIENYKCYLKLHTSAEIMGGRIIPLDSPFQTFGALTPFSLLTSQGADIDEFRNIELRMRCDSIPKKDGSGQHEFEMKPRPFSPLFLTVYGYNQGGQLVQLKGIDLKPAFEFGGLAYTTNSQVEFIVNPTGSQLNEFGTIKFANEPSVQDPLKPAGTGLFTTSERTISKPVRISADDLEFAIERSTCDLDLITKQPTLFGNCPLPPKTFTTELQFHLAGSFDLIFPELRDAGVLADRQIPIDQFILVNKMNVQVTEEGDGGFNPFPDQKTQVTKVEPVDSDGDFVIDGTNTIKNMRVSVTLDNYDRGLEGSVRGSIFETFNFNVSPIATTGLGCGFPVSTSGAQSNFICNFNILQNSNPADYTIRIDTDGANRIQTEYSLLIVREGAPVGGDDGCPDKYIRNSLGFCVLFGSTGTGGILLVCPTGTFREPNGTECITGTGGTGGGEQNPCPVAGQTRDSFGVCKATTGTGGVGTKSCMDCSMTVIRVVNEDDVCPVFECDDGTTTLGTEIMNCSDQKPADIIGGVQTCNRVAGIFGGLLPILVDCEGENRQANPENGEICVPAWVIGVFENLPLLIGIVIILIIVIAIIGAIAKKSPAGRAVGFVSGGFRP